MTAAYDSEDLHRLVDRLTPAQVRRLRLLVTQDEELSRVARGMPRTATSNEAPPSLLALIGAVDGPADLAERHDDYVRERMSRRFSGSA